MPLSRRFLGRIGLGFGELCSFELAGLGEERRRSDYGFDLFIYSFIIRGLYFVTIYDGVLPVANNTIFINTDRENAVGIRSEPLWSLDEERLR